MAQSWDFSGRISEDVDVMTCSELISYLTTDLNFSVEDMREIESELNQICALWVSEEAVA